ncbi:MAG TPA: ATP-binding protein [Balneolaceae bacterium]
MAEQNSSKKGASGLKQGELELLQKMFKDAPVFMCLLEGPDHRIVYKNSKFDEIYGNRSVSMGTPAREAWPETEVEDTEGKNIFDLLDKIYVTGEPYVFNEAKAYLDRTNTGKLEEAFFNFIYQPLENKQGEVYGIFVTGYEVTARVVSRKEKARHERRLQVALEGGQIGFWEFDLEKREFIFASTQFKKHLGRHPDDVVTREQIFESMHPDDVADIQKKGEQAMEDEVFYEAEFRARQVDESYRWVLLRGKRIYDSEGRSRRIGISIDTTRQKETEQRLKNAVKVRDDFLSIASHELQTPITSLKTRTELLEMRLRKDGEEEYAAEAEKITEQIDQLARLSNNLLDISRISEGKLSLDKEVFVMGDLIDETAEAMQHLSNHSIKVNKDGEHKVYADKYRIGQVLTNFISNAIKYSPETDKIIINTWQKGDEVFVSVTDFGIGISESDQKKVFNRFFRGSGNVKNSYPGIGIGLYISAEIIERHNGSIKVESSNGQGTVFTFSLTAANLN